MYFQSKMCSKSFTTFVKSSNWNKWLCHENIVFQNVLHEINLMGLKFINLTKKGQAKERKKTLNA
jgi:hypothetical protein